MTVPTYSPNDYDLTTVDDVISYLNVKGDATTVNGDTVANILQRLVTSASQFMQTQLNRTFKKQTYSEQRNGTGTDRMMVRNYPARS